MRTIFWTELRRSPLRWWLPLLIAMDLATLFGRSRYWIGVWPQASAAAQVPCIFLGPTIAAAAAWAAGRVSRQGVSEQVVAAARPVWQLDLMQMASTLTYGLIAYVVGVFAAGVVSISDAGPGFLWPSYILLGTAAIIGCAGAGHAVGRWSQSRYWAPIIAGIGSLCAISWFGTSSSLAFLVLSGYPQLQIVPSALAARIACAIALLSIAILVPPMRRLPGVLDRRRLVQVTGGVASLLALALSMTAVGMAGPLRETRAAPSEPVCTSTVPRVCLWPDDRKYLPTLGAMAVRLREIPGGDLVLPGEFYESGLSGNSQDDGFPIIEGSPWSASSTMAGAVTRATIPGYCDAVNIDAENRRLAAYFELEAWMGARLNGTGQPADVHGGPPGVDLAAIGRFIEQPESIQIPWVRQRLTTIRDTPCA